MWPSVENQLLQNQWLSETGFELKSHPGGQIVCRSNTKSEYQQTRFLVDDRAPVPARFGVVTACNPDGVIVSNKKNKFMTDALRSNLAERGYTFFSVTGCSPDLHHQEPGFGIVAEDRAEIVELGRLWRQEAVFWIERGIVHVVPCGEGEAVTLGQWSDLVHQPD